MWNFVFGYELGKRPKIGYVTMKSKGAWMLSLIITNMLEPNITKYGSLWVMVKEELYIDDSYYILKIIGLNTFL